MRKLKLPLKSREEYLFAISGLFKISSTEIKVLLSVYDHIKDGDELDIDYLKLAEDCNISESNARNKISTLRSKGVITKNTLHPLLAKEGSEVTISYEEIK